MIVSTYTNMLCICPNITHLLSLFFRNENNRHLYLFILYPEIKKILFAFSWCRFVRVWLVQCQKMHYATWIHYEHYIVHIAYHIYTTSVGELTLSIWESLIHSYLCIWITCYRSSAFQKPSGNEMMIQICCFILRVILRQTFWTPEKKMDNLQKFT